VDVIFNYSIRDATVDQIIKRTNPLLKLETDEGEKDLTQYQKFEQILKTHADNRARFAYPDRNGNALVKPITIFICQTQASAQRSTSEFVKVLADHLRAPSKSFKVKETKKINFPLAFFPPIC
jgi:hypothetical protein